MSGFLKLFYLVLGHTTTTTTTTKLSRLKASSIYEALPPLTPVKLAKSKAVAFD